MVFIGGIHGSGKTYFCERIKDEIGCSTYSASKLISKYKQSVFASDKLITDIEDNQQYLLLAINELNSVNRAYLLDGHLCLLNADGKVIRINQSVFISLKPNALILIVENPETIVKRRNIRDGINLNISDVALFQKEEMAYALELSNLLNIPFHIHNGDDDFINSLNFVQTQIRRLQNAR